jgi:hypothetical protein
MKKYNELKTEIILDFYLDEICKFWGVEKSDVMKRSNKREFADIRATATYLAKKQFSKATLKSISNYFGLKNHATVLHSIRKIENLKNCVLEIRRTLEHCEKMNFVDAILKSNGFEKVNIDCYSKEVNSILDIEITSGGLQNCVFRFTGYNFYEIKNIDIFDALIIAKNINSNPLGTIINSLKN